MVGFLDLPPEIRIMVYKYACALGYFPEARYLERPYNVPQLFVICHQVTTEAVALFEAEKRFIMSTVASLKECPEDDTFREHVGDNMYLIDAAQQRKWGTSYARFVGRLVLRCHDVSFFSETGTSRWISVLHCMHILAKRYANLKALSIWLLPSKRDSEGFSASSGWSLWQMLAQGADEDNEHHVKRVRRWMVLTHELAGIRVPKNPIIGIRVAPGFDPPVDGYKWAPHNFDEAIATFQTKRDRDGKLPKLLNGSGQMDHARAAVQETSDFGTKDFAQLETQVD